MNAAKKYGNENFEFRIIHKCDLEDVRHWEQKYIDWFLKASWNSTYNISTKAGGGDLGEEVNAKISKGIKKHFENPEARVKRSEQTRNQWKKYREKMLAVLAKTTELNRDRKHTTKARSNMSKAQLKRVPITEEDRKILRAAQRKRFQNPDERKKACEAGKKRSEFYKKNPDKAKIFQAENNNNAKLTNTQVLKIREKYMLKKINKCTYKTLAKEYNVCSATIMRVIKRETFKYI